MGPDAQAPPCHGPAGPEVLSGTVEVDESFIDGLARGKPGLGSDKISVLIAAEHLDQTDRAHPPRARAGRRIALVKFGQRVVAPGSTICIDGARQLRRFAELGYRHEYFTQLGSDVPVRVTMPAVHMAASQLKRWIDGALHLGISREQLAYHLDEFTFRFNRRTSASRGLLFYRLLPTVHDHRHRAPEESGQFGIYTRPWRWHPTRAGDDLNDDHARIPFRQPGRTR